MKRRSFIRRLLSLPVAAAAAPAVVEALPAAAETAAVTTAAPSGFLSAELASRAMADNIVAVNALRERLVGAGIFRAYDVETDTMATVERDAEGRVVRVEHDEPAELPRISDEELQRIREEWAAEDDDYGD